MDLVGRLETPTEGRVLFRPWPDPADALLCLFLLVKVLPCFHELYTCWTCTPAIHLQSSSLPYLNPGSLITRSWIQPQW